MQVFGTNITNFHFFIILSIVSFYIVYLQRYRNLPDKKNLEEDPLAHDIFKHFTVNFVTYLFLRKIYTGYVFGSSEEFFESLIGNFMVTAVGYTAFHHIVKPYFVKQFFLK